MTTEMVGDPERLPPIHPGEILREEFLLPLNISQYLLAKSIEVDPRWMHAIVNGERALSAEMALLFSRLLGNSAEFWMGEVAGWSWRWRRSWRVGSLFSERCSKYPQLYGGDRSPIKS